MNPGELIAWVGAVCLAVVIVFVTINIVVTSVRSIRNPVRKPTSIIQKDRADARTIRSGTLR